MGGGKGSGEGPGPVDRIQVIISPITEISYLKAILFSIIKSNQQSTNQQSNVIQSCFLYYRWEEARALEKVQDQLIESRS